ncbi:hypothetical protein D9M69_406480 [compost metagenome]
MTKSSHTLSVTIDPHCLFSFTVPAIHEDHVFRNYSFCRLTVDQDGAIGDHEVEIEIRFAIDDTDLRVVMKEDLFASHPNALVQRPEVIHELTYNDINAFHC